jgi:hypothetical protein
LAVRVVRPQVLLPPVRLPTQDLVVLRQLAIPSKILALTPPVDTWATPALSPALLTLRWPDVFATPMVPKWLAVAPMARW